MHIRQIFKEHETTFSFEFFPPRTPESAETLRQTIEQLTLLMPSYVSVKNVLRPPLYSFGIHSGPVILNPN